MKDHRQPPEGDILCREREAAADADVAEAALRQRQKMEALAQLTGGIAHDFNNLLQGITGNLELMQTRIAQGRLNELERFVASARATASRAAALTHRLLAFSCHQPLDPRPVSANPLLASMDELLCRAMGERIDVELLLGAGLWRTLCDPGQLEHALLNLASNARDAMQNGGTLTIETINSHLDDAFLARQCDVAPGDYVCIRVTDTGIGMPQDTIERAFEPFFTTKPIGQGAGLGLSMVYGFARQSEGHLTIHSKSGQGTTVELFLPRYRGEGEPVAPAKKSPQASEKAGGATVLVVEDEAAVRELVVETLKNLGYVTLEAEDGPSGLGILESKRRIDLLITDIGLPGLNGRKLAHGGRKLRPGLKVLFMTGYAANSASASADRDDRTAMLIKPFALEMLVAKIGEMIRNA